MWFIELIAAGLPFYRASDDAGINHFFNRESAALYLEGWAQERVAK